MRHKVLIAEDEPRMREVIAMLLSDLPLDFVEAQNGSEAIDLFDNDTFSLVITDIKLPKVNGMTILRHVKAVDSELPVIVITAFGSIENAVEAIHLVRRLRKQGTEAYFTCDAGPQPKVLCTASDEDKVASALERLPGITRIIRCKLGGGVTSLP